MATMLNRALQHAGLDGIAQRLLSGEAATGTELERLATADVLLLAGLADMVRGRFHGDEVRVIGADAAQRDPDVVRVALDASGQRTGQELLADVALARLSTPGKRSVAVSIDGLGLQLAQVALSFGADVLYGDLGGGRTLPLLDGPQARRKELDGLIARAGRRVRIEERGSALTLGSAT